MPAPFHRILYVEDEPDIRTIAQMVLEAVGGFTVIACASGCEALAAAPGAAADLLLLDVMLAVVLVLILFVQAVQSLGDWAVRRLSHK